jgi:cytochrome b561
LRLHQSILAYRNGRYLKLALLLCAGTIAAYAWHDPSSVFLKPYGGTALGYALGSFGALLILWLLLLGLRKRSYASGLGTVQGWTSAHVYLGASLIVVVSLHCGFEFGWNIHTLAYGLMVAVILSGLACLFAYLRFPRFMTENLGDQTLQSLALKIADIDRACRKLSLELPDAAGAAVERASKARIGGSLLRELRAPFEPCAARAACAELRALGPSLDEAHTRINQQLVTELTRKSALLDRVRLDLRLQALLRLWLTIHVPLSFALLAAVIAHVTSVFYYW